jgi:hypothetical protein
MKQPATTAELSFSTSHVSHAMRCNNTHLQLSMHQLHIPHCSTTTLILDMMQQRQCRAISTLMCMTVRSIISIDSASVRTLQTVHMLLEMQAGLFFSLEDHALAVMAACVSTKDAAVPVVTLHR